jgi:ADP-heptose:LPS heptosyltransferase
LLIPIPTLKLHGIVSELRKILLIQLRRLGDVLMTTPAIRQLHQALPDAELTFLTEAPSEQLLQYNPHLNEVWLLPKQMTLKESFNFLRQLRQMRFDCVIDFFGNPRSAFVGRLSGAPTRIGFDFRGRSWLYTNAIPLLSGAGYAATHKLQLLEALGLPVDTTDLLPEFPISAKERVFATDLLEQLGVQPEDKVVTISPVSRQPYKRWALENFAQLADWLIERYAVRILFVYGPGEQIFVDEVRSKMHREALQNYNSPNLAQTRAIFERVILHVGNDNGPRHFAVAADIPTVAIFGRPLAINWTPTNQSKHLSIEFNPGCKTQCDYPNCQLECLNTPLITVQEAIAKQLTAQQHPALPQ